MPFSSQPYDLREIIGLFSHNLFHRVVKRYGQDWLANPQIHLLTSWCMARLQFPASFAARVPINRVLTMECEWKRIYHHFQKSPLKQFPHRHLLVDKCPDSGSHVLKMAEPQDGKDLGSWWFLGWQPPAHHEHSLRHSFSLPWLLWQHTSNWVA